MTGLLDLVPSETSAPARSAAQTLALVRREAPRVEAVVFTRNRRVMASIGGGGSVLRLSEAFASAPERVVVAVGRLFAARSARARARAREEVGAFIRALPAAPALRRGPRTRRADPADALHLVRLQAEFDRVNAAAFDGALPMVPLHLSTRMRRRNGHFSSRPLEIVVSRRLLTHAVAGEAEATLRHEMIHLWQFANGRKPDHGRGFRAWARRLDVHPRATRPVRWLA